MAQLSQLSDAVATETENLERVCVCAQRGQASDALNQVERKIERCQSRPVQTCWEGVIKAECLWPCVYERCQCVCVVLCM